MVDNLKEISSLLRLVAMDVIIKNHRMFNIESFKDQLVQEIINEIKNTFNYTNNWLFDHFSEVAQFLIEYNLVQKDHIEIYQKYIFVKNC